MAGILFLGLLSFLFALFLALPSSRVPFAKMTMVPVAPILILFLR